MRASLPVPLPQERGGQAGVVSPARGCVKMKKDYHFVILSRAKNLENNSVCIQILHYVQDDIAF